MLTSVHNTTWLLISDLVCVKKGYVPALGRNEEAGKAAAQWKSQAVEMRAGKLELNWSLDGAETALENEANVATERKVILKQMLAAMKNPKQPLSDELF